MSNGLSWANLVKNSTPVETKDQNIETNRFDEVYHLNDDADYNDWDNFNNDLGFKIQEGLCDAVNHIRENTYMIDHMHAGLFESFFINHIDILDNIECVSSTDHDSTCSEDDGF